LHVIETKVFSMNQDYYWIVIQIMEPLLWKMMPK